MNEFIVGRLFERGRNFPDRPCCFTKVDGRWVATSWADAARAIRELAAGLASLGLKPGDRVTIIGSTRREWLQTDLAIQAAGGVTIGAYPTMSADQIRYILDHSESSIAIVEDKKQYDKIAGFKKIITFEPVGDSLTLDQVRKLGEGKNTDDRLAQVKFDDPAIFVYTSGTTGPPKGAVLSHGNIAATMRSMEVVRLTPDDTGMSFLPLAHVLQRMVDYKGIWNGTAGYYAESIDKLQANLVETRPTVMAAVPRIFEKIYAGIQAQAAASSPARQKVFRWAVNVGKRVSVHRVAGTPIPLTLQAQHRVARRLVYDKLRARLGGVRLFITGGAPIAPEILEFFHADDIEVLEAWGMSETCAAGTLNLPGAQRFGTIGKPLPGVQMKLDTDGEILIRGPNVMKGYFKDDHANKEAFTEDGFFRTGDIAKIDADGFWKIIDRKKELIITAGGKKIPPQNLENLLKQQPFISQAMAYGDRKPYLVAILTLDPAQVQVWARGKGLPSEISALCNHPDALALGQSAIDAVNRACASYESIKKFRIVPNDFTQETGELTPTLKIKRKLVTERYGTLIAEMYT